MQRAVSTAAQAAASAGGVTAASHLACRAAVASSLTFQPHRSLHAGAAAGNNAIIVGSFAVAAGAIGMRYALHVSFFHGHEVALACAFAASMAMQRFVPRFSNTHHVCVQAYNEWAASADTGPTFSAMKWHYRGGFEDDMTTSEAAKILGIRESSGVDAVRKAHRKLMILNHPDAGGSTFLAGKINEAKDKLMGMHGSKPGMD